MNPIIFTIGNFSIRWYSIILLIAFIVCSFLIVREGKRFKINKNFLINLIFWTVIMGIIGARLYYVIFNWDFYGNHLDEIIKVWHGGLAIHGGIIAGILTIIVYCKKYKVNYFKILDIVCVPMLLAQAIGRWGNFFNGEAHGAATTLSELNSFLIPDFVIKGMQIDGVYYQPTFFYESMWCLLGFIILMIVRRYRYVKIGQTVSLYLMWYSVGRFFIEISRTDALLFGGFKIAQIISVLLFLLGLIAFIYQSRKGRFESLYNDIGSESNIKF